MNKQINESDIINYKRAFIKAFRNIFSGTIKETFLTNVYNQVTTTSRHDAILLRTFNPEKMFSIESVAVGNSYSDINICKMIVMNHYMNTFMLTDEERGKKQNDKEYVKKLINSVLDMYEIEKLAAIDFTNTSLEPFLPIIYYTSAICNYCGNKYSEWQNNQITINRAYNSKLNNNMLYKMLTKIKACIALADIRAVDELIVVFRTLSELFMIYAFLWDKDESTIDKYYEFDQATFNYNQGKGIPDYIKDKAEELRVDKVKYLNYGWLDGLEEFEMLPKRNKKYSLGGLAKILDMIYGDNYGTGLYKIYKACNSQTHGTMLYMNYFELELHVFQNISVMLKLICRIVSERLFQFDFKINGIDLLEQLSSALEESRKSYDELQINQEILNKTNLDYRNRFICSLKMKS